MLVRRGTIGEKGVLIGGGRVGVAIRGQEGEGMQATKMIAAMAVVMTTLMAGAVNAERSSAFHACKRMNAAFVQSSSFLPLASAPSKRAGVQSLLNGPRLARSLNVGVRMSVNEIKLTPELQKIVQQFSLVPDPKLRYQQLLFFAGKLGAMEEVHKVEANKVKGCQSTVYVHATKDEEGKIWYTGDSDSQLTKGLCAMLVRGLSGNTVQDILDVSPEFVKEAGLSVSLTPSRNNGFLNMLNTMKAQAKALA